MSQCLESPEARRGEPGETIPGLYTVPVAGGLRDSVTLSFMDEKAKLQQGARTGLFYQKKPFL